MIILSEHGGKLKITKNGDQFNPPYTSNELGGMITVYQLFTNGSFSGTFDQFQKSNGDTFANKEDLMSYLAPFMGFSTAPGGSGANYYSAAILKTGQVLSHYPNDDGALQTGRDLSFLELPTNNPFGNSNRFTDSLGGDTYSAPIAFDWSTFDGNTALGYYINITSMGVGTWNELMDVTETLTISGFSGWRVPNAKEAANLCQHIDYGYPALGYPPFDFLSADGFWTSTNSASHAMYVSNIWGSLTYYTKNGAARTIPVRNFTLTELGL